MYLVLKPSYSADGSQGTFVKIDGKTVAKVDAKNEAHALQLAKQAGFVAPVIEKEVIRELRS
jgi:hypothetical protein